MPVGNADERRGGKANPIMKMNKITLAKKSEKNKKSFTDYITLMYIKATNLWFDYARCVERCLTIPLHSVHDKSFARNPIKKATEKGGLKQHPLRLFVSNVKKHKQVLIVALSFMEKGFNVFFHNKKILIILLFPLSKLSETAR